MAALDKIAEAEASAKIMGSKTPQSKGGVDREAMRELLGSEMVRELVLK